MKIGLTKRVVAAAMSTGLGLSALLAVATPAHAASTGGTTATFAITAGSLDISVPTSVVLATGTVNTGALSAAGQLGAVTVNDTRGALLNSWTTTVTTTAFTTGTSPTANQTVAASNVAYQSGASTATTGLGTFVPTLTPTAIGTGVTGASWTGASGNDSATWNPTITFTLLTSQVAGTYSGTITHSVA